MFFRKPTMIALTLGVLTGFDIIGTPLAILAIHNVNGYTHEAVQRDIRTRKQDCEFAEVARKRNRVKIREEIQHLPSTFRLLKIPASALVPGTTTTYLAQATQQKHNELSLNSAVNCTRYAHELEP